MPILLIALAVFTAYANHHTPAFGTAVIVAVVAFWSNGVLWNYRVDTWGAPRWALTLSMLACFACMVLLVYRYAIY